MRKGLARQKSRGAPYGRSKLPKLQLVKYPVKKLGYCTVGSYLIIERNLFGHYRTVGTV